jgi:hypothetical protein
VIARDVMDAAEVIRERSVRHESVMDASGALAGTDLLRAFLQSLD